MIPWIRRYRTVLSVSLPLVMSMAATTVMEFTDRVFLANYAIDAIAAAMPAGIAAFLFLTFFTGVAGYINVFVAQYAGAGSLMRIGSCLWQGIFFSALAALVLMGLSLVAEPLFRLGGHPPEVQKLESVYFRILCLGGGINVLATGLASFFTGRGKTRPVMVINIIGMAFNIPLDYALINGVWVFPEMGIQGAGIATVCSWTLMAALYASLIFTGENERHYGVRSQRGFDADLSWRMIKTGVPAALQFAMDVFAFTFFIFMVGRLGKLELAVSNIALSIESIVFMPAFGFSMGLSTLAGQALGRQDVAGAVAATRHTIHLLMTYVLLLGLAFLIVPHWILEIFVSAEGSQGSYASVMTQGRTVVRIMAIFIAFDAAYFSLIGLLKGAGDTRFIMLSVGMASLCVMIVPIYVAVEVMGWGLYACWLILTMYVISLFAVSYHRYRQGHWKTIRMI